MQITSIDQFLEEVKEFQIIYTLTTIWGRPEQIEKIMVAKPYLDDTLTTKWRVNVSGADECIYPRFINDMISSIHGVWTEESEANAAFDYALHAFLNDSDRIYKYMEDQASYALMLKKYGH